MSGFKPSTSGVKSGCFPNCAATTTAQKKLTAKLFDHLTWLNNCKMFFSFFPKKTRTNKLDQVAIRATLPGLKNQARYTSIYNTLKAQVV